MSCKYTIHHICEGREHDFAIEDFGDAIFCEGHVFLRNTHEHHINTAPGQCWGEYIDVPAGCYVDGEILSRDTRYCIDDVGQSFIVTEIISTAPLCIKTVRHIGVSDHSWSEDNTRKLSRNIATLRCVYDDGCAVVTGYYGSDHTLLIPAEYNCCPVRHVDLRSCSLENLETLIISRGVAELAIDFSTATSLRRIVIPDDIHLVSPLDNINSTPWFKAQRPEPVIIAGCYCGTPGSGSGGVRSLELPEGTRFVSAGADFHSYWHSIKFPSTLLSVGRLAFATCHCLEDLDLGEGIESIGEAAFLECPRLKSLYLPDSLRSLCPKSFRRCFYLQSVSTASEDFAERFDVHSLTLRRLSGDVHMSKCPPFVVNLHDRIRAYPPHSLFIAADKNYNSLPELALHPLRDFGFDYLDVHGRKVWRIAVRDDCRYGTDGEKLLVVRWFIKTDEGITQIEQTADGTILVRENINILDVDYAVRDHAARDVFEL